MAKKKRRRRSKKTGRRGRPSVLSRLSTREIRAEMERREGEAENLIGRRDALQDELEALEREIGELSGAGRARRKKRRKKAARRGRPRKKVTRKTARKKTRRKKTTRKKAGRKKAGRRKSTRKKTGRKKTTRKRGGRKSLADYLATALKRKTLSVSDATDAVQAAGYGSKSPNLRTMVNQQLLANPRRFKKVRRGEYTAK